MSLNRVFSKPKLANQVCQLCGRGESNIEPVVRTDLIEHDSPQIKEQLVKCQKENDELEKRCKKLMNSISIAANTREKQEQDICRLNSELEKFHEEKELALQRCEATYMNKETKIRQEAHFAVHEANERLKDVEKEIQDVVHLKSLYKLTWIPDQIVFRCMNAKCRVPFSQTKRRHHCRCCGRVFCSSCSSKLAPLEHFGYLDPVRMCNQCFALIDETFVEEGQSDPGEAVRDTIQ
ncbi:RUN and FYVE domain-containing protein 2-like isoform X2 [Dendronephthya gigantea]|nr:RUN and FYVE domain-containing protein 2-like isoform X2 [Dendronephthya gigantea]